MSASFWPRWAWRKAPLVPDGLGAVRLQAAGVRALVLRVGSDPEPLNLAHGQVWGVTRGMRRRLRNLARDWVDPLPDVALR
ncbi:MAG: hypothetical protein ACYC8V_04035 [Caulobacteraceae bacterium]